MMAVNYTGIKILFLRRAIPDLRENHIKPMQALLAGIARYSTTDRAFSFANGSRILFGYCDNDADILHYQGQEYDAIFMDEATQFTEFMFLTLVASLRGANNFPKRFYLTCNPGGVGHEWVKRLFIDKEYRNDEKPEDYTFIQALLKDNPHLTEKDPAYENMLRNLPEETRRAWLDGDWNVFQGQYFREWDENIHVTTPFTIPKHWRIYRTIDYGLDMFACLWIAVDTKGRAVVYKEIAEPNLIIDDAVRMMKEYTQDGENVYVTLAPPDMWNRRQESGKSVADIFAEKGVHLIQTGRDRISGWMSLHEWLRPYTDSNGKTRANLTVFSTCQNLIKSIPNLQHDSKKPNDVSTEPHKYTHSPDALRGFTVMWTMRAEPIEQPDRDRDRFEIDQYENFFKFGG